ncbi:GntR family transcriptional regulator [Dactylosporangium sp. AC04546]|uniref:GntR family transcriptional regulator n=1 Tax=Dactylosporangium sp. AC04546 TaxID=2862460 RepID=UPI001EE00F63|nr:GntR family transcriptional regulator [Dactylosporangium sp. AC04546]WVK79516.1 GntR family transcriptional regulator [Dactylosporangium sp. AC04546]
MVKRQQVAGTSSLISVPLYGQVLSILRQRILDGVYTVGQQLQPEDLLAAEFSVSRTTIRQAVGELVAQGLVNRRQGKGTFVMPLAADLQSRRYGASLSDPEGFAVPPRNEVIRTEFEKDGHVPARIAKLLELEAPVAPLIRRTRSLDSLVVSYAENFVSTRYAHLVTAAEVRKTGLTSLLETKGVQPGHIEQRIRAEQADIEISQRLEQEFASPVLYAERLLLGVDQQPIKFRRSWYPADLFEYRVSLSRDSQGEFRVNLA